MAWNDEGNPFSLGAQWSAEELAALALNRENLHRQFIEGMEMTENTQKYLRFTTPTGIYLDMLKARHLAQKVEHKA